MFIEIVKAPEGSKHGDKIDGFYVFIEVSIGHPKRGDVVFTLPGWHGEPKLGIVLEDGEGNKCSYIVLIGTQKKEVYCHSVFNTYDEAKRESEDREYRSFGPPSFESDFGLPKDPEERERAAQREATAKHLRRHEPPGTLFVHQREREA